MRKLILIALFLCLSGPVCAKTNFYSTYQLGEITLHNVVVTERTVAVVRNVWVPHYCSGQSLSPKRRERCNRGF